MMKKLRKRLTDELNKARKVSQPANKFCANDKKKRNTTT